MNTEIIQDLAVYINPVLIALVVFFLRNLHSKISDIDKTLNLMLIKQEGIEQRILNTEKDIEELNQKNRYSEKDIRNIMNDLAALKGNCPAVAK